MREPSTEHARGLFVYLGFEVEDIAEAPPERRADLRATFQTEECVIEAKLRGPHQEWDALVAEAHERGFAHRSRQVTPWSALSSTVTDAYEQLLATPGSADAFRILYAVALSGDEAFVVAALERRLTGEAMVIPVRPDTLTMEDPICCYHHGSNDFERCPGMVAAVVATQRGARLLVNYYSDQRESFRKGQLYGSFLKHGAVLDPEREERAGKAILLGNDFVGPRDGGGAQWAYIKRKYGYLTSVMVDHQFSGLATVSLEGLKASAVSEGGQSRDGSSRDAGE